MFIEYYNNNLISKPGIIVKTNCIINTYTNLIIAD